MEIEYEDELTELPDYCGEEITGMKEYSNIAIAIAETEKLESTLDGISSWLVASCSNIFTENRYFNYRIIKTNLPEEAKKIYIQDHDVSGYIMASKFGNKIKIINNAVSLKWLEKLKNGY